MKTGHNVRNLTLLTFAAANQLSIADPRPQYPLGLELDRSESVLLPYNDGVVLGAGAGPVWLSSDLPSSGTWNWSGGLHLEGTPIRLYLGAPGTATVPSIAQGKFEIWPHAAADQAPVGSPLFLIDSSTGDAKFNGLNLTISGGTLKVGTSPVLTESSLPLNLQGLSGQIRIGNGTAGSNSVAIGLNGPTASGQNAVAFAKGTASGWYSYASGELVTASGSWAVAVGYNSTASNTAAVALGRNSTASGQHSFATGFGTATGTGAAALAGGTANGDYSVAFGFGTIARTFGTTVVGIHSNAPYGSTTTWSASDPAFVVGNGSGWYTSSNAQVTLKNGQTTFYNRTWNPGNPMGDPDANDFTDAGGNAVVVNGHTLLRGKVVIEQRQGDIEMGPFQ
jgi:hypothetical protein